MAGSEGKAHLRSYSVRIIIEVAILVSPTPSFRWCPVWYSSSFVIFFESSKVYDVITAILSPYYSRTLFMGESIFDIQFNMIIHPFLLYIRIEINFEISVLFHLHKRGVSTCAALAVFLYLDIL